MSEKSKELVIQAVEKFQQGKLDDAVNLAREAIDAESKASEGYSILGIALAAQGKTDEATVALQTAIRNSPYSATHYYNLGLHYYSNGEKSDAYSMAQEAIRNNSKHKQSNELLKILEKELHVEVAPYQTSLGEEVNAYKYRGDDPTSQQNGAEPPVQPG
jgi:Flp pilus assembly protein TadD